MKMSTPHVTFEKLADLAEGRLPVVERDEALAHTGSCDECSAELAKLGGVVNLMREDKSVDAPRDLVFNAMSIFRNRVAEASKKSLVSRVLAALSFDSSAGFAPAFGIRAGQATTRQLLYNAGESDLDLRLTPAGDDTWVVSGQLLGECGNGVVELQGRGGEVTRGALNEVCEFALNPVPAGSYTLRLLMAETEIEVPELKI